MTRTVLAALLATMLAVTTMAVNGAAAAVRPRANTHALAWPYPGPISVTFYSEGCASGTCLALGSYETNGDPDNTTFAYVIEERSSSGVWSSVPMPAGLAEPSLVSCGAVDECVVVGTGATGETVAFTQLGKTWTSTALPVPTGWYPEGFPIGDLSCNDASCTAVGSLASGTYPNVVQAPAVWTLSDGTWSVATLPVPSATHFSLTGVSCVDASHCTAIGYDTYAATAGELLVAVDDGGTWSSSEVSIPGALGTSFVAAPTISCWAAGSCESVATFYVKYLDVAVVMSVLGSSVSFSSLTPLTGQDGEMLSSIECMSADSCLSVGLSTVQRTGATTPLAATLSGSTWTQALLPDGGNGAGLNAVACWSTNVCEAVGWSESDFSLSLSGTTWTIDSPLIGGPPLAGLSAVSCAAAAFCVAVGEYTNVFSTTLPVIESWQGRAWTRTAQSLPSGWTSAWLTDVSCAAIGRCVAVGNFADPSGGGTFADVLVGGVWTPTVFPVSPGWVDPGIGGISCPTTSSCVAVGGVATSRANYSDGTYTPLVEELAGGSWHASAPLRPKAWLFAVSCWAVQQCAAVGYGLPGAESLDGTVWHSSRTPLPRRGSQGYLTDVACSSSSRCLLVGSYLATPSANAPTALVESGPAAGPWRATGVSGAPGGFSSIGCNRAMHCVSVGEPPTYSPHQYDPGTPNLYERTTAGRWIRFPAPPPAGKEWLSLADGACAPSGSCVAVGGAHIYVDSDQPAAATVP